MYVPDDFMYPARFSGLEIKKENISINPMLIRLENQIKYIKKLLEKIAYFVNISVTETRIRLFRQHFQGKLQDSYINVSSFEI